MFHIEIYLVYFTITFFAFKKYICNLLLHIRIQCQVLVVRPRYGVQCTYTGNAQSERLVTRKTYKLSFNLCF